MITGSQTSFSHCQQSNVCSYPSEEDTKKKSCFTKMIDILNPEVSDTDIKQIVPPKKVYIMLLNLILCIDI